jgi:hypothetical protein
MIAHAIWSSPSAIDLRKNTIDRAIAARRSIPQTADRATFDRSTQLA